jgi:hypothetical protein
MNSHGIGPKVDFRLEEHMSRPALPKPNVPKPTVEGKIDTMVYAHVFNTIAGMMQKQVDEDPRPLDFKQYELTVIEIAKITRVAVGEMFKQ